ncbi:MAG TPA: XdhC family protein [Dehalococcoidales bacterium]|nr:XdhC family protein [Dehalococcoidales bacterium]
MEKDVYKEIVKIRAEGEEAALVTVISANGSTPQKEGAKMLVRADGSIVSTVGGGRVEAEIISEAVGVIKKCKPQRLSYDLSEGGNAEMLCGGNFEVFIEPILQVPNLFIFGGGHISLPLVKMANLAGFKIVVVDAPEVANAETFPEAEQTLALDLARGFSDSELKINKSGYVVIVTRDHKHDEVVLESALGTRAKYIGLVGSQTKTKAIFSSLLARGISQELLDKVYTPIGLKINARTPEEIAVSILAELIKVRRGAQTETGAK